MDFTQHREDFTEEDDDNKGKHPFSYSSSCSSYDHQMSLAPMSSWLGSNNNTCDDDNNNSDQASTLLPNSPPTIEKEHMFDKVVTPSDVGKLNRLVIPKQHAERYFPLDASSNEKGLLLNFEDRNGKPWRFRYSYWNSSQSYVMTKGWSRFVKEKHLDAGDIVSFQRGVGELGKDSLYIDWRRRPDAVHQNPTSFPGFGMSHIHQYPIHRSIPWSPLLPRPPGSVMALPGSHFHSMDSIANMYPHRSSNYAYGGGSMSSQGNNVYYLRPALQWQQGGGSVYPGAPLESTVFNSVPVVQGKAAAKRLRLFGVNMDCPTDQDDDIAPQLSSSLQLRLTPLQDDKGKAASSSLDLHM